jgi:hypothetical protein
MADDDPFYSPSHRPTPARQPRPAERLCEFVRASDGTPMAVDLRFHGDSYGWEALILERGELFASRGAFVTRDLAIQWAEIERQVIERST